MTPLAICLLQWDVYNNRMEKVLKTINHETFNTPIIANGNSPSWIIGHLADTDDKLLELFGIRQRMFPELSTIYHHDKATNQRGHLSKQEIQEKWQAIIAELNRAFKTWNENEWLSRHTAVKEEDFKKEPHRNKLNVMLSRVSHKASHLGQIAMTGSGE